MTVFRCPSGSFSSQPAESIRASAGPSDREKAKKNNKGKEKPSTRIRPEAHPSRPSDAELAATKARRNRVAQKAWPFFVFVGNVHAQTSAGALNKLFSHCGVVGPITFRQAISIPNPKEGEGTKYATVEFRDSVTFHEALRLNGVVLDGCKLVVCHSAADLPECKRIIQKQKDRRNGVPLGRELRRVPTEVVNIPNRVSAPPGGKKKDLSTILE